MIITIAFKIKPDAPDNIVYQITKLLEGDHPWLPGWVFEYITFEYITSAEAS